MAAEFRAQRKELEVTQQSLDVAANKSIELADRMAALEKSQLSAVTATGAMTVRLAHADERADTAEAALKELRDNTEIASGMVRGTRSHKAVKMKMSRFGTLRMRLPS